MSWSHDEAAQRMGMPVHEILAVAESGDCHVVTTHDGIRTLVTADGATEPYAEPAESAEPEEESADGEGEHPIRFDLAVVPDGTSADVLAWVGDEPDRAQRALEVENGKDKPRSSLVAQLEKLVSP